MKKLTQQEVYAISAKTIDANPKAVAQLVRKHGVSISMNPSKKELDLAFIALMKKSAPFRKDFSKLAESEQSNFSGYSNANGLTTPPTVTVPDSILQKSDENLKAKAEKTKGAKTQVGQFLSGLFTPEFTQDAMNTALNIWSVKSTGQNASVTQQELSWGRSTDETLPDETTRGGISTTGIVMVVLGVAALGGVAYYFYKKK